MIVGKSFTVEDSADGNSSFPENRVTIENDRVVPPKPLIYPGAEVKLNIENQEYTGYFLGVANIEGSNYWKGDVARVKSIVILDNPGHDVILTSRNNLRDHKQNILIENKSFTVINPIKESIFAKGQEIKVGEIMGIWMDNNRFDPWIEYRYVGQTADRQILFTVLDESLNPYKLIGINEELLNSREIDFYTNSEG